MKKYNQFNLNGVILWIILPILLFLFAMESVFAYFTATASTRQAEATTAIIRVGFKDTSTSATTGSASTTVSKVVPGDTITFAGKVENSGNMKIYAIIKYIVSMNDGSVLFANYYTAEGVRLTYNGEQYTTGATPIEASATSSFTLHYTIPTDFDNNYQGKAITLTATAYAIQYANIADAVTATNLLTTNPYENYTPAMAGVKTFNGTSDYVALGRTYMYTDKFTVHLSAYMDDWSTYRNNLNRIISCTQGGGWDIWGSTYNGLPVNGSTSGEYISFEICDSNYRYAVSPYKFSDLTGWVDFDLIYDGNVAYIYVNGLRSATVQLTGTIRYNPSNGIFIGAEAGSDTTTAGLYFEGQIANVYIINDVVLPLGVGLPSSYQRVEYIESTGTQYIDTGYKPVGNFKVCGSVETSVENTEMCVVGSSVGSSIEMGFSSKSNRFFLFSGGTSAAIEPTESIYNTKVDFIAKVNEQSPYKELTLGTLTATSTVANNIEYKNYTISLFALRVSSYRFIGKTYKIMFYDNNILVRNFIPCYRKSDNVIGMYDLVNNVFYTNAGTGTFIKGANV